MTRREAEWRVEDVAAVEAVLEADEEPTSFGVPVSKAYDNDFDPANTTHPEILAAYSYVDYASMVVDAGRRTFANEHGGEKALEHRVFHARVIPRPKPLL